MPVAGRRDQLVLAVVQPGDRALLRADVREVQHLHEDATRATWESGQVLSRRLAAHRAAIRSRSACCKAIDIRTGAIKWELPQPGPANSWGGTLATATGLVFFGEDGGALMAADAVTGKPLWSFPTNQTWKASPMTYMFDGKQYIAVAAGANIIAFGIQ